MQFFFSCLFTLSHQKINVTMKLFTKGTFRREVQNGIDKINILANLSFSLYHFNKESQDLAFIPYDEETTSSTYHLYHL